MSANLTGHGRAHESNSGRRILVVSTDLALRERLYDLLSQYGHSVKTVHSGDEAIATLRHERPDAILADSAMTVSGGRGFPDRIRTFDTDLPIILFGRAEPQTSNDRTVHDIPLFLPSNAPEPVILEAVDRCLAPRPPLHNLPYHGTALLVDDEPELLESLREFLEPRGCTVLTATSGEQALDQLTYGQPTVVLLDIKMPGMDGLVTLKKIKTLLPSLPVIMATAVEDEQLMSEAFALGAYEYVTKPYNLRALQAILLHLSTLLADT